MSTGVRIRRSLARSRLAPVAALPVRTRAVARHDLRVLRQSAKWLWRSREHTNYTYDLTERNREHLAWFVSEVAGVGVHEARTFIAEIEEDCDLRGHVRAVTKASGRRGLADEQVRYGRRVGWYALIRAVRPSHVVETGTDKGLGTCVMAAAILRNGTGHLTTMDVNPESGYLVQPPYSEVVSRRVGESLRDLRELTEPVDLFLHDSLHTAEYEAAELAAVQPHLTASAIVLSDNSDVTDELLKFAEQTHRRFLFFDERPHDHWFPGGGIGVAL